MLQKKTAFRNWALGLSSQQAALLRQCLGDDYPIRRYSLEQPVPSTEEMEEDDPFLIWVSSAFCKRLQNLPAGQKQLFTQANTVLLLDEGYALDDFETACDCGILEIVRPPLTRERAAAVMRRELEARAARYDAQCMTREILLVRELLERKNELLEFLVGFFTNTAQSPKPEHILQTAFSELGRLLPARGVHAILWERDACGALALSLYISAPKGSRSHEAWRNALLEQARPASGEKCIVREVAQIRLCDEAKTWRRSTPDDGAVLCLPLISGAQQLGVVLLLVATVRHMGRDQIQALDSAMRHLALLLRNTRPRRIMRMNARDNRLAYSR